MTSMIIMKVILLSIGQTINESDIEYWISTVKDRGRQMKTKLKILLF